VQGIVRLTQSEDAQAYATAVQARDEALARSHALLSSARWRSVPVAQLIEAEVRPYGNTRVSIGGPELEIDAEQVQPLALVLHEMLSNAHQHGALSASEGTVTIRWEKAGEGLVLQWAESGGPPPPHERIPRFGSRLIGSTVERQLVGQAMFHWKETGLESRIELPLMRAKTASSA
jgi:two-component sensor histidine kinase